MIGVVAPKLPLLLLPRPAKLSASRQRGFSKKTGSDRAEQVRHLSGAFERIDKTFKALMKDPLGAPPEKVLVLETRSSAAEFRDKLLEAVEEEGERLQWLLDVDLDDIDVSPSGEEHPGRLYLMMVNHHGARELVTKFRDYKRSMVGAPYAGRRRGKVVWLHLFDELLDIRFWGLRDRLILNHTLDYWQEDLELSRSRLRFEVELWWRASEAKRMETIDGLSRLVGLAGGSVIDGPCIIPGICYCGMLVDVPNTSLDVILPALGRARDPEAVELPPNVSFLKCDDVMFFRPRTQADVVVGLEDEEQGGLRAHQGSITGKPILGLLDGMPLENHVQLAGRITVDDPEDLGSRYLARHRRHGTAMASLILHGDLQGTEDSLGRPLLVHPIMHSRILANGDAVEELPGGRLALDAFHVAVRRLLAPESTSTIKVINVSLGDHTRIFDGPGPSPWARLLDYLAYEYGVLFVVSAGNCWRDIEVEGDPDELRDSLRGDGRKLTHALLAAMYRDTAHRKLRSPGESINALTVGALHDDDGGPMAARGSMFDPLVDRRLPSPMTSFGMGVRRAVKPDLVVAGGRQPLREPVSWSAAPRFTLATGGAIPMGHRVAAPRETGVLDGAVFSRGTSNAAALTSRAAAQLYEVIEDLRGRHGGLDPDPAFDAVLLKAMLVHGARWPESTSMWKEAVQAAGTADLDLRDETARAFGYGTPDFGRVAACAETRATAVGVGQLEHDRALLFRFPLPESIGARTTMRRLVLTLAYLTPIHAGHQRYRRARLWVEHTAAAKILAVGSRDVSVPTARRGTLEHVVLEGEGTAVDPSMTELELKVNCRADAGELRGAVPFALLVTLEVAEGETLPIYQQVMQRLRERVRGRA